MFRLFTRNPVLLVLFSAPHWPRAPLASRAASVPLCLVLAVLLFASHLFAAPASALDSLTRVSLFSSLPAFDQVVIEGRCRLEPLGLTVPQLRVRAQGNSLMVSFGTSSKMTARRTANEKRLTKLVIRPLGLPLLVAAGTSRNAHAHHYRGLLRLTASGGRLQLVDEVDTRSYITSVVGSESLVDFPLEALKAQTVLATTVLAASGAHGGSINGIGIGNGNIGDSTELQAYLGSDYERPRVQKAVSAVFGEILSNGRTVKPVYYHSTCAGGTSTAAVFTGAASEGKDTVKCSYCSRSPFFKELRVTIPLSRLRDKLGFLPEQILTRDAQGRPLKVLVLRSGRQDTISGYDLWLKLGAAFGWGEVPGLRYHFEKTPGNLVFISSGAGHGVGMCQWGATGMARTGKSYKAILNYYFPGAKVGRP